MQPSQQNKEDNKENKDNFAGDLVWSTQCVIV